MFTGVSTLEDVASPLNAFNVIDGSSYISEPKNTFLARRVYFQLIDGTFIQDENGNDYWGFGFSDYPDDIRPFDFLDYDVATSMKVLWVPITPVEGSVYETIHVYDFKDYLEQFAMNIALNLENNKSLANIQNFMQSTMALQTYIDCADNRQVAQDQYSDQQAIEAGTYITNNPNLFY